MKRGTRFEAQGPQADFVVFKKLDGWYVRFAMKEFGPHTRAQAIAGALRTAKMAEKSGKPARVREQRAQFQFRTLWPVRVASPKRATRIAAGHRHR
jgi:hypothetical protein